MDPAAERPDPQGRPLSDDGEDVPWCLERIAPSPMEPQDDRAVTPAPVTPARTKRHRCTARSARFTIHSKGGPVGGASQPAQFAPCAAARHDIGDASKIWGRSRIGGGVRHRPAIARDPFPMQIMPSGPAFWIGPQEKRLLSLAPDERLSELVYLPPRSLSSPRTRGTASVTDTVMFLRRPTDLRATKLVYAAAIQFGKRSILLHYPNQTLRCRLVHHLLRKFCFLPPLEGRPAGHGLLCASVGCVQD